MSKHRILAPVLICSFLAACASQPSRPPAPSQPQRPVPTVRPELARPLREAESTMKTRDFRGGIAQVQALASLPGLTPYEVHAINEVLGYGFSQDGELQQAADYLERGYADGYLPAPQRPARLSALATINYQLKNFPQAVKFGTLAVREGGAQETIYVLVSQAYYLQGDYRGAATFTDEHVQALIAGHEIPSESALQLVLSSCAKLGDHRCTRRSLEELISYHPNPQYQAQLDALRQHKGNTP